MKENYKKLCGYFRYLILLMLVSLVPGSMAKAAEVEGGYEYDFTTGKETYVDFDNALLPEGDMLEGALGTLPAEYINEEGTPDISTFQIIGQDGRQEIKNTKAVPLRWTGYIKCFWPDGSTTMQTAFLYGENVAITAGHSIYNREKKCYPQKIVFCPAYNKNGKTNEERGPYGSFTAKKAIVTQSYKNKGSYVHDAGVIKLDYPIGKKIGYFGIQYKTGDSAYKGQEVWISGYAQEKSGALCRMGGKIIESSTYSLTYDIDVSWSQAGSPIYIRNGNARTVIGIAGYQTSSHNVGTRITKTLFNWLNNTKNNWNS